MLKKLVALTLGVGLFCGGGLCHAATIENHITDMKGKVITVYLHKETPNATGLESEWVLIDSPNQPVSKAGRDVVKNDIEINKIADLTEGTYDAVAFEHELFDIKGNVVVERTGDDKIDGTYKSTATPKKFVKSNEEEEFFKDDVALSSEQKEKFWHDVMNNQVGSIYSENHPDRIITAQKLSKPVIITEEINAQGEKVKYANIDSFDYAVRAAGLWAGQGWPDYKGTAAHYDSLEDYEFTPKNDGTMVLDYGDKDSEKKPLVYTWKHEGDTYTLQIPFIDNIEIEEPETK